MASFLLNICTRHQRNDKKASRHTMKCHAIVLLLWITTASVRCDLTDRIVVKSQPNGILLSCKNPLKIKTTDGFADDLKLEYKDENSGEYECMDPDNEGDSQKIYVKFRTCDNCVELELVSLTGILMGNLVATVLIGVAVYLTASHRRSDVSSSTRKSSDRQHLVPSESRNRPPNDHYQPLNHKGQKDTYDVLTNRR
ncbi:T-cell surface glycoprotein CD3 gamma chain-like [Takifugu flavidus]|uniref:T-cell surface glycoprotein CD3 delta chain n=1 Tax=Takifugu flavidus TaxID=433684 RepID=A0A5C6PEC7_9TELE|nr:T-cell surface glycoprotein CD3 gamma chain-like [Takifugu flavidus]TWW77516.1 T-cell surface glycoprotein CD3 delta chain [Takifugu flavidus]